MGLGDLSPWHLLIIAAVILVLFGSAKLPKAAKSLGEAMRIFKNEAQKLHTDDKPAQPPVQQPFVQQELPPQTPTVSQQPPASAPPAAAEVPHTNQAG
jgi:sec-independent protein translocase protein TatA